MNHGNILCAVQVGWGPLVVWLCLKVLARMFHITMVLLETLASNDTSLALGVGDITESPVSTPRGASTPMDSQLYAPRARMQPSPLPGLQRSVSASAAGVTSLCHLFSLCSASSGTSLPLFPSDKERMVFMQSETGCTHLLAQCCNHRTCFDCCHRPHQVQCIPKQSMIIMQSDNKT